MARILIIDDDEQFCRLMAREIGFTGHETACAFSLEEGMHRAASRGFDVVFLDVRLPDGNGLEAIPEIRRTPTSPEVIIITGMGTMDGAELAIQSGAWDYIEKPSSLGMITLPLARALEYRDAKRASRSPAALRRDDIKGSGSRMKACFDLLSQAASVDASVLITGETGTGKELFARAIHENSPRASKEFVVVDCAALKDTLAEGILFGHEKGAFTGADRRRGGLIGHADGGTLFLDEIGELPFVLQKTFLRVLQERRFRPLGASREIGSDFRLIAATNRKLDGMVATGAFRSDLLFRLRSIVIEIPPLREHPEDIGEIAIYHIARICRQYAVEPKGFSPEFFEFLCAYDWPGNIRELVNALERAVAAALPEPTLFRKHLPNAIRIKLAKLIVGGQPGNGDDPMRSPNRQLPRLKEVREAAFARIESEYLRELMATTGGNISLACELSGLKRTRLYQLLKKHEGSCPE